MRIESITVNFKIALFKNGLSISKFANALDINTSYANQIVNGKRTPSPKLAKKMAQILNVDITDIFNIAVEEVSK
ncbi:transcriptional regulator with XRE-family HTH domain [Staphylococcus epidermidis]|uniref:helix-turn-helix domain-containing protein n=1 Tax=Staphylococcus epidermidis TaxID=1282 RepID=UPI001932426E|nr:helix-turn-helix transcriptional regulator [Staphylococcus epidermidis]MBM0847740.1 XRE family transcriptional regulator [Staphylococcus epidermidis]